jgi:hypothetical protein
LQGLIPLYDLNKDILLFVGRKTVVLSVSKHVIKHLYLNFEFLLFPLKKAKTSDTSQTPFDCTAITSEYGSQLNQIWSNETTAYEKCKPFKKFSLILKFLKFLKYFLIGLTTKNRYLLCVVQKFVIYFGQA